MTYRSKLSDMPKLASHVLVEYSCADQEQVSKVQELRTLTETVMKTSRLVDAAKDKEKDIQRKHGKSADGHVGQRYRRRGDQERARLAALAGQAKDVQAQEAVYLAEMKAATQATDKVQGEFKSAADQLTAKIAELGLSDDPALASGASFYSMRQRFQRMLDDLEGKKKEIEDKANQDWTQRMSDSTIAEDRDVRLLFGDIQKTSWMVNPNPGSTSATLQKLEQAQREIEQKAKDANLEYKDVQAYFMYSETRKCAVMLYKTKSNPATWDYKYYYTPCPVEEVVKIFNSCKGKTVSALRDYAVDANAFANVPGTA